MPHIRLSIASLSFLVVVSADATAANRPVAAQRPITPPTVGRKVTLPRVFRKAVPTTPSDLKEIEKHIQRIIPKLQQATVGVRSGRAQGSGVIISPDGYVMTAGHVSGSANRPVSLIFPDGKAVKGITLGAFRGADAGLIKITAKGTWPHVPIGRLSDVRVGEWCMAMGHPGGFRRGRPPVVRLGRVISRSERTIHSDAVLVGGDSGGPLFDMHGRVIGINSRIGRSSTSNYHASVAAFSDHWVHMARGNVWTAPVMGVNGKDHRQGCEVTGVPEGYPAAKAGIKLGDIITDFNGSDLKSFQDLVRVVSTYYPGDTVFVDVIRNGKSRRINIKLADRGR